MTDAASLADRVRGDLRLHELEAHADADTAAEARRLLVESQSGASLDAVGNYGFPPRRPPSPPSRTWSARSRCRWASPALSASTAAPSPARSTSPRDHRGRAPRVGQPRLLGHQQRRRRDRPRPQVRDDPRAGVPRRRRCRGRGARPWTRDNFAAALKEAAEETTNHGELLDVTPYVVGNSVYLRFRYDTNQGRDGDEHGHHRHRGRLRRRRSRDGRLPVAPLGQPLFRQEARRHQRRRGRGRSVTADVRIPREVVEERLHTTPEAVAELNTRKNLVGSAKAASLGFNAHVANVVAAMFLATGQDEAQVVEGANAITTAEVQDGDLYVSVSIASLEVGTVGGGTKLLTQSEGLDILGVSGGGDPAGSNADALAECIAVGSRGRTLPSPRSPRGTSPAPTPNSVGNCMGVVVRPRFIGSEFVDPTLIMNVLSREIPRDYEIPEYNAYHEHITKG